MAVQFLVERTPSLGGSLRGWVKTLEELRQRGAHRAVPGHGPVAVEWPAGSAAISRYLSTLERETRETISKGVGIETAIKTVGASEREKWKTHTICDLNLFDNKTSTLLPADLLTVR